MFEVEVLESALDAVLSVLLVQLYNEKQKLLKITNVMN
jgi:hypothetical protein